jgi:hypothetical protein
MCYKHTVFVFLFGEHTSPIALCLACPRGDAFMKRLMNKIAIVTGASRVKGIGTAICRELAREGADIFFTHWSKYDRQMQYFIDDDSDWSQQGDPQLWSTMRINGIGSFATKRTEETA